MQLTALRIHGTDRKAWLQEGTLRVVDQLDGRDTVQCALLMLPNEFALSVGQSLEVEFDGTVQFGGTIDRVAAETLTNTGARVRWQLDAVDYAQLADRFLHAELYESQTLKAIVQDMVADTIAADGVTLDPAFPTGPTLEYFVANYETVAQLLTRLAEMTGYHWRITPQKRLQFLERTTLAAPAALNDTSPIDLEGTLRREATRAQYRNVQYMRGGITETDVAQTETFVGDGTRKTFTVSLPVSRTPTITVNGVAQTVGVRQIDTGKQWYWQEGSTEISQDSSGSPLTSAQTLAVSYRGYFPLLAQNRSDAAITERQTVEGGSGIYQHLQTDEAITSSALARDRTLGLLRRYGTIQQQLEFDTLTTGWQAGQLLSVSRAALGLSGTFLVAEATITQLVGNTYQTTVRAVGGEAVDNWVEFWARVLAEPQRTRRANEVVHLIRTSSEPLSIYEYATRLVGGANADLGPHVGSGSDAAEWSRWTMSRYWPGVVLPPSRVLRVTSAQTVGGGGTYGGVGFSVPTDLQTGVTWELRAHVRAIGTSATWSFSHQSGGGDQSTLSFQFTPSSTWGIVRVSAVLDANKPSLYLFANAPSVSLEVSHIEFLRDTLTDIRIVDLTSGTSYSDGRLAFLWAEPDARASDASGALLVRTGHVLNGGGVYGGAAFALPLLLQNHQYEQRLRCRSVSGTAAWTLHHGAFNETALTFTPSATWQTFTSTFTLTSAPGSTGYLFSGSADQALLVESYVLRDLTISGPKWQVECATVGLSEVVA